MRPLLILLSLVFAFATAQGQVVRLAPEFTFPGIGGKTQTLKNLRGQPVVLLITTSPKSGPLKSQVKFLREIYQQFANKKVIFIAAYTGESGPVVTDIPFLIANNGPAVAAAYGLQDKQPRKSVATWQRIMTAPFAGKDLFNIVIIGQDGNIDYQTDKVLPPERVRDVVQNSYAVQSVTGR